ncbi:hypothetical protein N7449_001631 [Penicillium cf. viridicatum]|uniref:Uncharacterized protein n=1 Tax=Penicillium cf. viridicatum TaxID=2972119 RepID=A0A9W9N782_9EURO|nr:hypothetical protein N7449_001631 [Penicillium cf. viridicatum]
MLNASDSIRMNIARLGREFDVAVPAHAIHGRNALSMIDYHRADPFVCLAEGPFGLAPIVAGTKKAANQIYLRRNDHTKDWKNWIYRFLSQLPTQLKLITCWTSDKKVRMSKILTSFSSFSINLSRIAQPHDQKPFLALQQAFRRENTKGSQFRD